jgi:hypothetical protein
MNIALVAKRGSGKTTVSSALQAIGYQRLSWADPVRELAAMAYDPRFTGTPEEYAAAKASTYEVTRVDEAGDYEETITGTQLLQRIGTEALRDGLDQNFWVKAGLRRVDAAEAARHSVEVVLHTASPVRWVNDDTRFPNELQALRSRGFVIVGLHCEDSVRVARLIARDGFYDKAAETHSSETSVGLDDCDVVIRTDVPLNEVMRQLDGVHA